MIDVLNAFHTKVDESAPVRRLLERWDRTIEVRTSGGESWFLTSRGGTMLPPSRGPATPDITIEAAEPLLRGIFSGEVNPARAHLDGELQAYGSPKDQLVLDSIVLLIWGY